MLIALLLAQAAPATCPTPAPPPAELAGWTPMTAVAATAATDRLTLPVGHGVRATLLPVAAAGLALPSDHARPGTSAGVFAFQIPARGRYRVALGAGAWIDVIVAGRAVDSVAHGHGPACSPVRKMVDFDLPPGRYLLQLTGSDAAVLPVMIARLPAG